VPGGGALGRGQRAVGQGDPDRLGQVPLPGLDLELAAEGDDLGRLVVGRPGQVGVEGGVVVVALAGPGHRLDRAAAGERAGRVADPEHSDDEGAHAGRERELQRGRGRQPEHLGDVPGLALAALDVLAGFGQRYQRDEEHGDEAPAGPVPVRAVAPAAAAEEHAVAERPVDDAQAPDKNEHVRPSVRGVPAAQRTAWDGPGQLRYTDICSART
jgi:hypothetical protein